MYEGYGPSGVAVIVETLTDNRNRTAGDVRHYFDKFGGNLGTSGCVSFLFSEKGVIVIEREGLDEDKVMEDALEAGAADFKADEDGFEVYTEPDDFSAVREDLEGKGYEFVSAEVEMVPSTYTTPVSYTHLGKDIDGQAAVIVAQTAGRHLYLVLEVFQFFQRNQCGRRFCTGLRVHGGAVCAHQA